MLAPPLNLEAQLPTVQLTAYTATAVNATNRITTHYTGLFLRKPMRSRPEERHPESPIPLN